MTGKAFGKKIIFLGASAALLGACVATSVNAAPANAVSADKAAQPAKAAPVQKRHPVKPATAKHSVAKPKAAKKTAAPVGGAGWIYREPGSPMPSQTTTRNVIVPRIQAAKDPKNGIQMTLPPLTSSVAVIDSKGNIDYRCDTETGGKAKAGSANHAGHNHK